VTRTARAASAIAIALALAAAACGTNRPAGPGEAAGTAGTSGAAQTSGAAGTAGAAPAAGATPSTGVAAALGLSADEAAAIVSHGPWPPPAAHDASNRASGDPAAIELGRRLFVDRRLSPQGTRSCASCHRPELGWADGLPRSAGADGRPLDRNAPGLLDARDRHWLGWDGGADSLWSFVLRPLVDPRELGADDARLAAVIDGDPALACLRRAAFGPAPEAGEALRVQVAKALAAFVATLESPRTAFDELRDALADPRAGAAALEAARAYPADALRGLRIFVGEGRCALCHVGPAFTHGEFHDIGRPHMTPDGRPDPGRHAGIRRVRADPYNRLGRWSDATDPADALRTRHVAESHRTFGEFRVPALRGAVHTAPYGHDGSMKDLEQVIAHYSELDVERLHADGESLLRPLRLDGAGRADLVAFLATLSAPAPPVLPCAAGP
jgi:cytochrome c peroxidase